MNPITPEELRLAVRYKLVKKIRVEQTKDCKYLTHVTLAKEDEEKTIVTQRGTQREWASLDRLVKHLQSSDMEAQNITLTLYEMETTQQTTE